MDQSVWDSEPYTEQDLANQISYGVAHEPGGAQILQDGTSYVNGINAYIAKAKNPLLLPSLMPAEYVALGRTPQPFRLEDLVSIATLVEGIFGNGGGDQLSNALLYENLARRFADPEAPTTVRGHAFPYQTLPLPGRAVHATLAMPDPGSVSFANHVVGGAAPRATQSRTAPGGATASTATRSAAHSRIGLGLGPPANAGPGLMAFPRDMSNALLVSGAHSASGHPIAVMGPQVSYFAPQILMEEDIHGPGIDASGAAFPGVNLYLELGHGRDYAWSATSSGQNIIDTFAMALCNPAGGRPTTSSGYYLLQGRCVPMETLTRSESWTNNPADSTPAARSRCRPSARHTGS